MKVFWKSVLGAACMLLASQGTASGEDADLSGIQRVEAGSELVDATDPEAVAALLASEGYQAVLSQQPEGTWQIQSAAAGTSFWLYFQACAPDHTGCEVISLVSGFDFDQPQVPGILGDWNRRKLSKAYLDDDGDPFVEFSVNMVHGISRDNFIDTLNWFAMEIVSFMDQIGWHQEDAESAQPI